MGPSFTLCDVGDVMKVDQTNIVSLAAKPRRQQEGDSTEIGTGGNKKATAVEPQRILESSKADLRSKPVILNDAQFRLRFERDKETGIHIIQVVDAKSGKLVRQIPPEELLNITKALREIKGLMISKES